VAAITEPVPDGVTLVRAPNAGPLTLTGTNTWLVESPAWLIDPGPADVHHVERVVAAVEARGGLAGIALTHGHLDHAESIPLLRERFDAPVAAAGGEPGDGRFDEPSLAKLEPDLLLEEGSDCGPFGVLATPGHSRDHVALLWRRVAFCGDTVLGEGSVFIPPGGGSLSAYLDSLRRLRALEPAVLCPGHGPVVWEADRKLGEYLSHRLDRERRLVDALDRGLRTRDDLLDDVWEDAPAALRLPAALTLEAHLEKLEEEGLLPAGVERL
jgi:glyoxylase-like metal-dependent hydrolase (beta-lactamase superfamily II)